MQVVFGSLVTWLLAVGQVFGHWSLEKNPKTHDQ